MKAVFSSKAWALTTRLCIAIIQILIFAALKISKVTDYVFWVQNSFILQKQLSTYLKNELHTIFYQCTNHVSCGKSTSCSHDSQRVKMQ
jgi:hypothetical protein